MATTKFHPRPSSCPHCYHRELNSAGKKNYKILFTIGLFSVCECLFCGNRFLKAGV